MLKSSLPKVLLHRQHCYVWYQVIDSILIKLSDYIIIACHTYTLALTSWVAPVLLNLYQAELSSVLITKLSSSTNSNSGTVVYCNIVRETRVCDEGSFFNDTTSQREKKTSVKLISNLQSTRIQCQNIQFPQVF